jgi:hypothetical protein
MRIRFRPRSNDRIELDSICSVDLHPKGGYIIWTGASGGPQEAGQQNRDRAEARKLFKSRLSEVAGAVVKRDRIGGRQNVVIGAPNDESVERNSRPQDWQIPEGVGQYALWIWLDLPAEDHWDEPSLCSLLQFGDRTVANVPFKNDNASDQGEFDSLSTDALIAKLRAYRNLIVEGVAGTGKSHMIKDLKEHFGDEQVRVVVFHPSTSYEDFVEGLRPHGESGFRPRDGVFLQICREAARHADREAVRYADPDARGQEVAAGPLKWVLVIDEINRANTSKVLGDLLYAIEPSKRVAAARAHVILSATSQKLPRGDADEPQGTDLLLERTCEAEQNAGSGVPMPEDKTVLTYHQRLVVPDNLYILGTMNTTDRSVGTIDLALRRRFVIHRMEPMKADSLKQKLANKGINGVHSLDPHVDTWQTLNDRLRKEIGPDSLLGHSYFFEFAAARKRANVDGIGCDIWRDMLLPQLAEILVAFNAASRSASLLEGLDTGGWTLQLKGHGVDAYPMVVRTS